MNDFERDVERMLHDHAAELSDSYDAPATVIARVRRRRAAHMAAVTLSVVAMLGASAAVVAAAAGGDRTRAVISKGPPGPTTTAASTTVAPTIPGGATVATVACPVLSVVEQPGTTTTPSTTPRAVSGADLARLGGLVSFAGDSDARYVVLGPKDWSCLTQYSQDGNNDVVVYPPDATAGQVPSLANAPIAVDNDWLWHGGVGSPTACSVFSAPALVQFVTQYYPSALPCPAAGRAVTMVGDHAATFVDPDGARGGAWMKLPSSQGGDGLISVLTCRPTAGLTVADCETIVADYIARVNP